MVRDLQVSGFLGVGGFLVSGAMFMIRAPRVYNMGGPGFRVPGLWCRAPYL